MAVMLALLVAILLAGCDGDPTMRERHGDARPFFVRDVSSGECYIVRHHIGGTYSVRPHTCMEPSE